MPNDRSDFPFIVSKKDELPGLRQYVHLDDNVFDETLQIEYKPGNGTPPHIVGLRSNGYTIDQVNYDSAETITYCLPYDYNQDRLGDLVVTTLEHDSLFARIDDIYHSNHSVPLKKIPLYGVHRLGDKLPADVSARVIGFTRSRKGNRGLMICELSAARSLSPRGIAAYDTISGKIQWYYPMGTAPGTVLLKDVDRDGSSEIFVAGNATDNGGNQNGTDDAHSYVFGLSADGDTLWHPHVLGEKPSRSSICIVDWHNNDSLQLLCVNSNENESSDENFIERLDPLSGAKIGGKERFAAQLVDCDAEYSLLDLGREKCFVAATFKGDIFSLKSDLSVAARRHFKKSIVHDVKVLDINRNKVGVIALHLASDTTIILDESLNPQAMFPGFAIGICRRQDGRLMVSYHNNATVLSSLEPNSRPLIDQIERYGIVLVGLLVFLGAAFILYTAIFYAQVYRSFARDQNQSSAILLNRRGKVLHINDATVRLFAGVYHEKKSHWSDFFRREEFSPISSFLEKVVKTDTFTEERLDLLLDHTNVSVIAHYYPLRFTNLKLGSLILFSDISKDLRSDRMINWALVAHNLAHEMKTPLSTIWFTLERLRQEMAEKGGNADEKYLKSIEEEIRRLDSYVKGFMKLANLNPPNLQSAELNTILQDILGHYREKLPDSIHVVTDFAQDLPNARCDVNLFTAALTNIMDNSVAAMGGDGTLKLSTYLVRNLQDTYLCIAISDTGCGIAEEDVPKVFNPYFSKSNGGTGLGLVITKKIVEDHGGRIHFKSRKGLGTEFVIEIPPSAGPLGDGHA